MRFDSMKGIAAAKHSRSFDPGLKNKVIQMA
jgi:hypothetical protein